MIRRIQDDEVELISPIMEEFNKESDSQIPPNFMDRIKTSMKNGKSIVYGAFSDNNNLEGIGIFGNVSKRISFVYSKDNSIFEEQLIDTLFNTHSSDCEYIGAAGSWVSENISNRLLDLGFRKLDRATMTLGRKSIESLDLPRLSKDMEYNVYDSYQINELSRLVFKSNDGQVDQIVFPNFFGSVALCKKLIENIENNVYGDFKKPYSWLLRKNGQLIGACFMTIREKGKAGYIPDIVIDPDYQRQGLGKGILIHSMKEILSDLPDMEKIDLDVTSENNARFLYKSVGFEIVSEYSMYTWLYS